MGDVQRIMMNVMNEIHRFNQMIYDARGHTAGVVMSRDTFRIQSKVTGKIGSIEVGLHRDGEVYPQEDSQCSLN